MPYNSIIKQFYQEHRVPSPVNFTLTQRQVVDGQWISDEVSQQNFRHFANLLNSKIHGKAFKRFGKKLSMFVVREHNEPPPVCRRLQSKYGWSLWKKVTEPTDFQLRYAPARFG